MGAQNSISEISFDCHKSNFVLHSFFKKMVWLYLHITSHRWLMRFRDKCFLTLSFPIFPFNPLKNSENQRFSVFKGIQREHWEGKRYMTKVQWDQSLQWLKSGSLKLEKGIVEFKFVKDSSCPCLIPILQNIKQKQTSKLDNLTLTTLKTIYHFTVYAFLLPV